MRAAAVLLPLLFAAGASAPRAASASQAAYSVQLHVHGSFSEGDGSLASQTQEALGAGVDAIWWSDHDHRISFYHHPSAFSFEAPRLPLADGESWTPNRYRELEQLKGFAKTRRSASLSTALAGLSDTTAYEGARSLRLEAVGDASHWGGYAFAFAPDAAGRQIGSLASGMSVEIAIFPERVGPDARVAVAVGLSQHPANQEVPFFARYFLKYVLNNDVATPVRKGSTYLIPLPYVENQWNFYSLPVTQHAVEGFPFIDGEDNNLRRVQIGVEARRGGHVIAYFDAYRQRHEIEHEELFAKQAAMLSALAAERPAVAQLQGVEISNEFPHLNEFSVAPRLADYDELILSSGLLNRDGLIGDSRAYEDFVATTVVDRAHARGGLVSYNHIYGTGSNGWKGTREQLRDDLLRTRVHGSDIFEVGYRARGGWTLADYLWLWDELARNQVYLVGSGVSDSHGGAPGHWLSAVNNFVSFVYADSTAKTDLLEGLKTGNVFFGDIGKFDGTVHLSTSRGFRMGQIVLTDRASHEVQLDADGLAAGDEIRIVEAGALVDLQIAATSAWTSTRQVAIDPDAGSFVRFEAYDPGASSDLGARAKVFSNPIYFARSLPEGGVRPERAALDLGGIASRSFRNFTLKEASFEDAGGTAVLTIAGIGAGGEIVLDHAAWGPPDRIDFVGLTGSWSYADGLLTLSGLSGDGAITVSSPSS